MSVIIYLPVFLYYYPGPSSTGSWFCIVATGIIHGSISGAWGAPINGVTYRWSIPWPEGRVLFLFRVLAVILLREETFPLGCDRDPPDHRRDLLYSPAFLQ